VLITVVLTKSISFSIKKLPFSGLVVDALVQLLKHNLEKRVGAVVARAYRIRIPMEQYIELDLDGSHPKHKNESLVAVLGLLPG